MDKPLLTHLEFKVLEALFKNEWVRTHFYLTGGGALAGFHYGHRYSEDLDLFTHGTDLDAVPALLRDTAAALQLPLEGGPASPSFHRFRLGGIKVEFVRDVDSRVGSPELRHGILVDCVKNIAVNKVCAIYGRLDAKDYVDLDAILAREGYDLFELFALAKQKDGGIDPFQWAQIIADVGELHVFPRMAEPLDRDALVRRFRTLRDRILDRLKPER